MQIKTHGRLLIAVTVTLLMTLCLLVPAIAENSDGAGGLFVIINSAHAQALGNMSESRLEEYRNTEQTLDIVVGQVLPLDLFLDGGSVAIASAWTSSDPTAAVVGRSGLVTGRAVGTAVITGTYEGQTASVTVRVSQTFARTAQNATATCGKGYHLNLNMDGTLDTYYYTVRWSEEGSAEGTSASVDGNNVFRPTSYGTVTVIAEIYADREADDEPDYTQYFKIEVIPAALSVSINSPALDKKRSYRMEKQEELTIDASVAPASALQVIRWESSDPEIAEVVDGKVVAHRQGDVTLTGYAQYWDGLRYNDVTISKTAFKLSVWDETRQDFAINIIQPSVGTLAVYKNGVVCEGDVTAKPGEQITVKATGVTEELENGFKQYALDLVQAVCENTDRNGNARKSYAAVTAVEGEQDTFTFTMPVGNVTVSATPVSLFTLTYETGREANLARSGNLIGRISVLESTPGAFNGSYTIRFVNGGNTVAINDIIATEGETVINEDGSAVLIYNIPSEGEAAGGSEIEIYADAQDAAEGQYDMQVSGTRSFTAQNAVNVHKAGAILDTDVIIETSRISSQPQGGSVSVDAGTGVIIYGDLFREAVDRNISFTMRFSAGTLVIPYSSLKGIENVDDNAFLRFSLIRTSPVTDNSLGDYELSVRLYSGKGLDTNLLAQVGSCTLKIANSGLSGKAAIVSSSLSGDMTADSKEYSVKLDKLSGVSRFTVTLDTGSVNRGDILLYAGVGVLAAALAAALIVLRGKRRKLQKERDEENPVGSETDGLTEEGREPEPETPFTDDTFRTVQSVLQNAGLEDEASRLRQNAEDELKREQARGRADAALARHDIETASGAAATDASLNGVSGAEGQVAAYLASGQALLVSAADILERCDIAPGGFADDALMAFTLRLRRDIDALNSGVGTYKADYDTVGAWILGEKEAAEARRIQAVRALLSEYESVIGMAEEHWQQDSEVLRTVREHRLEMDAEADIAAKLAELDTRIAEAEASVNNLASDRTGARTYLQIARSLNSDSGIADKTQKLRDVIYAADGAAAVLNEAYRSCYGDYSRIISERNAAVTMRKATIIASIGAYLAIAENALADRGGKLEAVLNECVNVYPAAVDTFSARYSAGTAFLAGMTADVAQARGIEPDRADDYDEDMLQELSDRLRNDFADTGISDLYAAAMRFIASKKQDSLSARLNEAEARNAELRSELDSRERELTAALAGLGNRGRDDGIVSGQTVSVLEALLARENTEYPANIRVFTECIPADREANLYIRTMRTLADRVHANAAKIASADYRNAGENQVADIIRIITDDLDLLLETRRDIESGVQSAKPHKYGRKKLKYWKKAMNSSNPGLAAEASNRVAAHRESKRKH